ncbi:hypothetical protein [Rhodoblastus sp.]|uniref:hypothetical protein n=1 Tax=Rhodoblastus sp. TaxID=1962975 RepID=UPI002635403D|nr:hypothetical protein [Rhodoblastus sp.]
MDLDVVSILRRGRGPAIGACAVVLDRHEGRPDICAVRQLSCGGLMDREVADALVRDPRHSSERKDGRDGNQALHSQTPSPTKRPMQLAERHR